MTQEEFEKQAEEYLSSKEGVCVGGCEYSYHHNNAIKKAFQAGAKCGMGKICETCAQHLKEFGKPCAFRSLGNEHCWE